MRASKGYSEPLMAPALNQSELEKLKTAAALLETAEKRLSLIHISEPTRPY